MPEAERSRPKILFDENVSHRLVEALSNYVEATFPEEKRAELIHQRSFSGLGELDEVWIPRAARERSIVVTADHGRSGGAPLPRLCVDFRITHVLLSPSVHDMKSADKSRALIFVYEKLFELSRCEPGGRYSLQKQGAGFCLMQKDISHLLKTKEQKDIGFDSNGD